MLEVVHPPVANCDGSLSQCGESCHWRKLAERNPHHKANFARILRLGMNFGRAVVQHVAAGMPLVSSEVKAERLDTCENCVVDGRLILQNRKCEFCGCNMDVKAGWMEQKCPLGRWTR
jgi:hypothetical protein